MEIQLVPDYKSLENSLIDVIKEEQIKLGYRKETIRLYYPMESVNHLLSTDCPLPELKSILKNFCTSVKETLGEVTFSSKEERICFIIPSEGVTYVHEKVKDRIFLEEFIQKISEHNCSLEDLLSVFRRHSDRVVFQNISNGEFDYLIYFKDGKPDKYRYCIKFEDCHGIYHRFTTADYENFGF